METISLNSRISLNSLIKDSDGGLTPKKASVEGKRVCTMPSREEGKKFFIKILLIVNYFVVVKGK